jgi:hypothetical protein
MVATWWIAVLYSDIQTGSHYTLYAWYEQPRLRSGGHYVKGFSNINRSIGIAVNRACNTQPTLPRLLPRKRQSAS